MISPQDAINLTPPSAWRVVPFWSLFRRTKSIGHADEELLSVYRDHGVVPTSSRDDNHNKPSEDLSGYQLVTEGALVTNKMKAWQGSIAISRHRGIVSPAYYVYQPLSEEHDQFLHYLLRSEPYIALYQRISKGVRVSQWDLEHEALRTIPVLLPDLATQKQIADFLDAETARIDALIEKKQRLTEVLALKESNLRNTMVFRGIKNCKLVPSGVEWFGDVPAHWVVCRFNRLIASKVDYRGRTPEKVDDGVFLVTARNIRDGRIDYERSQEYTTQADWDALSARGQPEIGDVIFTTEAPLGQIAQVDRTDVAFAQRIMKFRANKVLVSNDFLAELMMSASFQRSLQLFSSGSTAAGIKSERLAHLFAVVPPKNEQVEIVDRVRSGIQKLRDATAAVQISIDRLREYRAALITAAVTGQFDVAAHARPAETVLRRAVAEVVQLRPSPQLMSSPDRRDLRVLVAADVVHRLGADPYLGRTKLQKLMFLAEAHANINDIAGRYQRYRYGPYDDAMVQEIELGLRQDGYYDTRDGSGVDREKVAFLQMSRAGGHRDALAAALGGKTDTLRQLVDLFKGKDTEATEAVATLYAVWNDALIDGKQPDDAAIIRGFLQDWHPEKGKFKQADLQTWLGWMHRHGLVPKGTGPRTVSTNTPSLFERE